MMNKTCVVFLWSRAGIFLLGACLAGWGTGALATDFPIAPEMPKAVGPGAPESVAAVESESVSPAAPESVAESVPRLPANERLETLKSADLETQKAAQEDCMKAAEELSSKVPDLYQQMRAAYEAASQNDPAIQAMKRQIVDLQVQMEKALENHPAVLEKRQAIDQAQQDMLAELQLRTKLEGMIAAKEQEKPAQTPE